MKKLSLVVAMIALTGSSAFAGNNPRIDQALMEGLAQKKAISAELQKDEPVIKNKQQINARYRAVEVLEMGDELGGFTSSTGLSKEISNKTIEDLE